jgi:hypothetical protein
VNSFQLEAIYPEYKKEFQKIATKEFAASNIDKIKEVFLWLKSRLR